MDVDLDTGAAATGGLAGRAGETRSPHVLDASNAIGGQKFKTGLKQKLLAEGISHLDGGAIGLGLFGQLARSESGPSESIATGLGPDIEDRIADSLGGSTSNLLVSENA